MDNVSNYYSEGLGMYGVWVVYEGLWAVLKRFYVIHRLSGMQVSCYYSALRSCDSRCEYCTELSILLTALTRRRPFADNDSHRPRGCGGGGGGGVKVKD